jgi:hypothetical protein
VSIPAHLIGWSRCAQTLGGGVRRPAPNSEGGRRSRSLKIWLWKGRGSGGRDSFTVRARRTGWGRWNATRRTVTGAGPWLWPRRIRGPTFASPGWGLLSQFGEKGLRRIKSYSEKCVKSNDGWEMRRIMHAHENCCGAYFGYACSLLSGNGTPQRRSLQRGERRGPAVNLPDEPAGVGAAAGSGEATESFWPPRESGAYFRFPWLGSAQPIWREGLTTHKVA